MKYHQTSEESHYHEINRQQQQQKDSLEETAIIQREINKTKFSTLPSEK